MSEVSFITGFDDEIKEERIKWAKNGSMTIIEKKAGPLAEFCFDGPQIDRLTIPNGEEARKLSRAVEEIYGMDLENYLSGDDAYLLDIQEICEREGIPHFASSSSSSAEDMTETPKPSK